ncbi:hypothetical protein D3C86_1978300 [compost metagenome]
MKLRVSHAVIVQTNDSKTKGFRPEATEEIIGIRRFDASAMFIRIVAADQSRITRNPLHRHDERNVGFCGRND